MMIGTRGARRARGCGRLESAQHRQIEVEDDQIRRPLGDGLQRFVAGPDDVDVDVAALKAVLDQPGNVLLVVDDEHLRARSGANAAHAWSLARVVSEMCGTRTPFPWE